MASGSPRSYDRDSHATLLRAAEGRTPADPARSDEPQPVRAAANCVCRPDTRGNALADLENSKARFSGSPGRQEYLPND
jgi:hypothetical protein